MHAVFTPAPGRLGRVVALLMGLLLLVSARPAKAQGFDSEVRLDQLSPAPADSPFTRAIGPREAYDDGVAYALRVDGDYQLAPLTSRIIAGADDAERKLVEHALLLHVGASLSPFDWLDFELGAPFALYETGEDEDRLIQQARRAGKAGVGDIRIGAHARPIVDEAFGLSLGVRFWAPSGTPAAYMGGDDRFFRLEAVPAVAGEIDAVRYGCTLGIAPLFFAGRDGDRVAASCALQLEVLPILAVGVEPHVGVFAFSQAGRDSAATPGLGSAEIAVGFEPMVQARLELEGFFVALAGGPGIGNAPGTPDMRINLSFGYGDRQEPAPVEVKIEDRDLDGLPDDADDCPDQAGPEERRGCPAANDADGDGIVEGDACPDEAGATYDDPKANGCPDTDNDHVADPVDRCPMEPGAEDEGGCPKYVRLKDGQFEITPPIEFLRLRSTFKGESKQAILELVRIINVNEKLDKVSIEIGAAGMPQRLTEMRAEALLQLLNDENLARERYQIVLDRGAPPDKVVVRVGVPVEEESQ